MEYCVSRKGEVRFVSAPCSTGKTRAACKYIATHHTKTNCLYVAPSLKLLNETACQIENIGIKATVISSETHPKRVKSAVIELLNSSLDCGHVLLITWNCYVDLPYFNRKADWEIIIDEVPQLDRFYRLMLPHNYEFLTDQLKVFPTKYPEVLVVSARKPGHLKTVLDGPRDDVHEVFRPLYRDVLSGNKDVYVDARSWYQVAEVHEVSERHEDNTVYFLSMLKPDPLVGAILLGANLKDSMLYLWFRQQGIEFAEEKSIAAGLRSLPSDLGKRIRISYFIPGRNMSKALSRTEAIGGGNLIDRMDELAAKEFGGEPAIYIANNDRDSKILENAPKMIQVPVVSNGLNSLQDYQNIYFSASLNREPKHFAMLKSLGFSSEVVHQATAHETCYQAVMRTSLRNPECTAEVHAIVPDSYSAKRLAELLGGHEIERIGELVSAPKEPLTQTERTHRSKFKCLRDEMFAPRYQQKSSIYQDCSDSGAIVCPPNLNCIVTFHKTKFADEPGHFVVEHYEIHDFLGQFRKLARTKIDNKSELFLWNPATFDPKGGEGYRRQEYFVQSFFMVLDFDDGTLSPEEFEDIFWHEAERGEKHSFIIHNSFRCQRTVPNRFRVILFYRCPAQSIEEHQAVYDYIVRRLEEKGHTEETSKLDPGCRSGNQSFWVPSINRAHPEFAFIRTHGEKTRDLKRYALAPYACPVEERDTHSFIHQSPTNTASSERFLAKADEIEAEIQGMSQERHSLFFTFGVYLAKSGLDTFDIQAKLSDCAGSESKMRNKVRGVMTSLKKYHLI